MTWKTTANGDDRLIATKNPHKKKKHKLFFRRKHVVSLPNEHLTRPAGDMAKQRCVSFVIPDTHPDESCRRKFKMLCS